MHEPSTTDAPTEPRFLKPAEVAVALKVSVRTVLRLIDSGEIPARRVGDQWRVPAEYLEDRDDVA